MVLVDTNARFTPIVLNQIPISSSSIISIIINPTVEFGSYGRFISYIQSPDMSNYKEVPLWVGYSMLLKVLNKRFSSMCNDFSLFCSSFSKILKPDIVPNNYKPTRMNLKNSVLS